MTLVILAIVKFLVILCNSVDGNNGVSNDCNGINGHNGNDNGSDPPYKRAYQ